MNHLFLLSLAQVVWIDVLLSGDNALVIAMACRALEPRHRFWAMVIGAGGAIALRILLTGVASSVLEYPYLKLLGAVGLAFIAMKMLLPEEPEGEDDPHASERLLKAVGAIVVADLTMSIDNVLAVAVAARGSLTLLVIGLCLSIPLIITGASFISTVLNKFPFLVWLGAGLLGWIAGTTAVNDSIFHTATINPPLFGAIGIAVVLGGGFVWRSFARKEAVAA